MSSSSARRECLRISNQLRMSDERLDVVIFGATGFTGKYAVQEAQRIHKDMPFTWGIAGRRKEALQSVLQEFASNSNNVKIIIADLRDEVSLRKMCQQAKVVVNCCGPYRFYGEPVIKACIESKTHHVDVSGEPEYMERMQLEYNKAAEEAGIYVVSACGFDSIPFEMGIAFTDDKFSGQVNSIETYLSGWLTSDVGGAVLHHGTWESALHHLANESELAALRRKLYPDKLPEFKPVLKTSFIHRNPASPGYSVVFPGPDLSVALRTQRFMFERYKVRPIQVQTYVTFRSLWQLTKVAVIGGMSTVLSKCRCGLSLLTKHPKFFSWGLASHEGPKEEIMDNTHFSITFLAKGWTEKLTDPTDQYKEPPNKELVTKVTGVNPAYGLTNTTLLISALMIVKESYRMPGSGGVLSPGAAFAKTSMVDDLMKYDLKFEIVSSKIKQNER
ncbi:saccharopine dehydrogenase-like oxidoreductase isoform X2 [Phymastichus coffea]|uniref:saccharopine dehydrogenase-like oxidoreductase isoform X2 n=1 Tax=Phymastichus coffea TaxID=108790 RepID=UPI00273BA93D|nr:saccharopine dehydrogenase-like oxidoreductase isoform X2 [Phymastichus coffea]